VGQVLPGQPGPETALVENDTVPVKPKLLTVIREEEEPPGAIPDGLEELLVIEKSPFTVSWTAKV